MKPLLILSLLALLGCSKPPFAIPHEVEIIDRLTVLDANNNAIHTYKKHEPVEDRLDRIESILTKLSSERAKDISDHKAYEACYDRCQESIEELTRETDYDKLDKEIKEDSWHCFQKCDRERGENVMKASC